MRSATASMRAIWAHAGEEFNVNSTPQLRVVLFEKLGLVAGEEDEDRVRRRMPTRSRRCGDDHPIVDDLLRYREVEKLRSTYADALPAADRGRRACARDLQADRHDDRPDLERSTEPPERPGAHRRRTRVPAGVHRRGRLGPPHRRLLADRAAGARAPRRGPGSGRRVRARRRHPHRDRRQGVPRGRVRGRRPRTAASPRS